MDRRSIVLFLLLMLIGSLAAYETGLDTATRQNAKPERSANSDKRTDYELIQELVDILYEVENKYVREIDRRDLMKAAINGILAKLDKHSKYISPDKFDKFNTSIRGEFGGIGIQIVVENGNLKIVSPLVGSPAYRAGLQAGDLITEIEGQSTKGITLLDAVRRLKGDPNTKVKMKVLHARNKKEEELEIKREKIRIESILGYYRNRDDSWEFMLDDQKKIAYVRVTNFSYGTAKNLAKVLTQLKKRKIRALVLDLRFNPGGLLNEGVEVSRLFLDQGKIIVTVEGRNHKKKTYESEEEGPFLDFPMVILVNRSSASASEIVSACLQDHQRAIVVGERTWGKGSVQNVIPLRGGKSALKLTTSGYKRPNGKNIHRFADAKESDEWGVSPDDKYALKLDASENARLIRYYRKRGLVLNNPSKKTQKQETPPSKPQASNKDSSDKEPAKGDAPERDAPERDAPERDAPEPGGDKKDQASSKEKSEKPFVDRQLEKALEYLREKLSKTQKG